MPPSDHLLLNNIILLLISIMRKLSIWGKFVPLKEILGKILELRWDKEILNMGSLRKEKINKMCRILYLLSKMMIALPTFNRFPRTKEKSATNNSALRIFLMKGTPSMRKPLQLCTKDVQHSRWHHWINRHLGLWKPTTNFSTKCKHCKTRTKILSKNFINHKTYPKSSPKTNRK